MKTKIFIFIIIMVGLTTMCFAAVTNEYRSIGSGQWSDKTKWERYNGTTWVAATAAPSITAQTVTIRNTHTISIPADRTVDQVVIDNGGVLSVDDTKTLTFAGNTVNNGTITTGSGAGTINLGTYEISGTGTFTVTTTSKLLTAHTGGIAASGSSGAVQCSTRNFSSTATYEYNGSTAQVTGTGLPSPVQYVKVSGTGGLTLSQDTTIGLSGYTGSIIINSGSTLNLNESGVDVTLAYGTMTVNGTLVCGATNLVSGSGDFAINAAAILMTANVNGISKTASSGSIQTSGARNYYAFSSYVYNGTAAQVTGDGLPTGTEKVHDLTIDNAAGVSLSQAVIVDGTLYVTNGTFNRNGRIADFDGYWSPTMNYLEITEDEEIMTNSTVLMEVVPDNLPEKVKRQWTINTTQPFTDKVSTFYWTADDDRNWDWSAYEPAVFDGTIDLVAEGIVSGMTYDASTDPRWIQVKFYDYYPTGPITIGLGGGSGTLPVELSSFTSTSISYGVVRMDWVTQSETGLRGFYIYRNSVENLASAELVSPLISATNTSLETSYSFIDRELPSGGNYYYWLQNTDINGGYEFHGPATVVVQYNGNDSPVIPLKTRLNAPYPNPFNPELTVSFDIAKAENVQILIYNSKGQKIRTLLDSAKNPGYHRIVWDGKTDTGVAVTTGMYYVKMTSGNVKSTHKVMMMK